MLTHKLGEAMVLRWKSRNPGAREDRRGDRGFTPYRRYFRRFRDLRAR